jgi:pimeloyl-ACP methyl ester carboxylesterase
MTTTAWDSFSPPRRGHVGLKPPSRLLWLAEYRSLYELGFSLAAAPLLLTAPRGDGHPVLVLPGFMASDASTQALRAFLKVLGYDAYAWDLGRNLGGIERMRGPLLARLNAIFERTGRHVSVIGWSLGGIYARLLGAEAPEAIRSVITLGSPFSRDPRASNVSDIYQRVSGEGPTQDELTAQALLPHEFDKVAGALDVPATSIFSKLDGIVDWHASLIAENDRAENIEVLGASHIGLGVNAAVLWAVADRLAQADGSFAPFKRRGPFALAYGRTATPR